MAKNKYKVACGRIVGRSHTATQTNCQDAVSVRKNSMMASVALADGAGSRARSEIGAKAVVREVLRVLTLQFDDIYRMCDEAEDKARRYIHLRLIEVLRKDAARIGCDIQEMASTLLFVAHKGSRFIAGHIGDGVIIRVNEGGKSVTLSHPENGEYANTTVFVTDSAAVDKLRLYYGESDVDLSGFVIMSDGCAESLYDKKTGNPAAAISKLIAWNRDLSRNKMESILASNLEQAFAKKSADDCSLAIMNIR